MKSFVLLLSHKASTRVTSIDLGAMKSIITGSFLFVAALIASVAASSSQFSSPHVADLGKTFDEKVSL